MEIEKSHRATAVPQGSRSPFCYLQQKKTHFPNKQTKQNKTQATPRIGKQMPFTSSFFFGLTEATLARRVRQGGSQVLGCPWWQCKYELLNGKKATRTAVRVWGGKGPAWHTASTTCSVSSRWDTADEVSDTPKSLEKQRRRPQRCSRKVPTRTVCSRWREAGKLMLGLLTC